jgi:transposase
MRAAEIALTSEQRATLQSWLMAGKTEQRLAFRAQIILALGEGLSNKAVAAQLATRAATVSKWRGRFVEHGLAGVADAPRSGKPRHYDTSHERRIIAALDAPPPKGYARWDGSLLAEHLRSLPLCEQSITGHIGAIPSTTLGTPAVLGSATVITKA